MNFENMWERVKAERKVIACGGLSIAAIKTAIEIAGDDYLKMVFLMHSKTKERFEKYCEPNYKWCVDTHIKKDIIIDDELPIGTVLLYAEGIEPVMIKAVGE